ncbi:MAG: sigma-70 family RNA polymerase sigma factor [Opitutae bacterium]|nr:sigma-70 family RNA polymerase sigma factor [Opitutae bacterium]
MLFSSFFNLWLGLVWRVALDAPVPVDDTAAGDDDAVAMSRLARGDEQALQQLFDRWKLPLLNYFCRSLGSQAEAEDLTLEVFVRLHRAAGDYRPTAKFSTFLFLIARNLLRNELRRRRRKPAVPTAPDMFDTLAADTAVEARRLAELEEVFQLALTRLPEKYRTALLLLLQQRMDYAEAAAVLRITENALRVLVHRGRQLLKTAMEDSV